ncbi:hypothetical protein [Fibrella arboris]|uniref:hypothetical protein n=1 Tax=Fibrella arboris TaxID=3242486 RepID=UPI00352224D1
MAIFLDADFTKTSWPLGVSIFNAVQPPYTEPITIPLAKPLPGIPVGDLLGGEDALRTDVPIERTYRFGLDLIHSPNRFLHIPHVPRPYARRSLFLLSRGLSPVEERNRFRATISLWPWIPCPTICRSD